MMPAGVAALADVPLSHSRVGGRAVAGVAGRREVVSPASGQAFAAVTLLDAAQAAAAVEAAERAFPAWSARSFAERGAVLGRVRDRLVEEAEEIAALIEREQGKPAAEAYLVELFPAAELLKHLQRDAEELLRDEPVEPSVLLLAHKEGRLVYEPLGVVLAVTPWNYPFLIALSSVATALIAGNTAVLKPAPATTLAALRIAELFEAAGAPEGVLGVVACDDTVAAALVRDPRVAKIVFTGSVPTGRKILEAAAANLTPVVLELGGKDAAVVCRDADLDLAARGVVWGAFFNAGQTCASVERVYVERAVAEPFLARVVEHTRALRVGDPAAGAVDVGPLTLERQRRLVADHVADAVARGARVLAGGEAPAGGGWFYAPTVLAGVDHTMRIMREETFGPVLPVMAVDGLDEAIRLANQSEYGLTASAWTRDPDTARRLQRELHAGVVTVNDAASSYGEPGAPWGGRKQSGYGRIHGRAGLREMVHVKYVARDTSRRPLLWWFPYDRELRALAPVALRALHGRGLTRLASLAKLAFSKRVWRRGNLGGLLRHADKLF
ncbi:MAG TPA: aldehyde dehydrogenase family protein [Vicinamibacteria bacterium]